MNTKFFTNKNDNNLINKFKGVFENQSIHSDVLIGYFRASGYFQIRPLINDVPEIRILVGINIDKLISEAKEKGQQYLENTNHTKEEYLYFVSKDISESNYNEDIENGIIQFIEDIITKKIVIKAHGQKNLHAKVYIFRPQPFNEHTKWKCYNRLFKFNRKWFRLFF